MQSLRISNAANNSRQAAGPQGRAPQPKHVCTPRIPPGLPSRPIARIPHWDKGWPQEEHGEFGPLGGPQAHGTEH